MIAQVTTMCFECGKTHRALARKKPKTKKFKCPGCGKRALYFSELVSASGSSIGISWEVQDFYEPRHQNEERTKYKKQQMEGQGRD